MFVCASCSSFVPPAARACPACGLAVAPAARVIGGVVTLAGSSLFAMTLSACYGVADPGPRDFPDSGPPRDSGAMGLITTCDDLASDLDGDGYCGDFDCDEADASVNDGAADAPGDGVDSNCDGAD